MVDRRKYVIHAHDLERYVKPEFLDKITANYEVTTCENCEYRYIMLAVDGTHTFCTKGCFKPVNRHGFCSEGRSEEYDCECDCES